MSSSIRVSLPGYDALTDTNLDHYSLYADIDNILIKRLLIGTANITDGSPTILTIPHNLGYIPFFLVYCDNNNDGNWQILNNQYNLFSVPQEIAVADTTNLYIYNYGGHASGSLNVIYEIFYDNMNDNTAPSITDSNQVIKISRPGKDTSSTNPNDYIMHSDLNNYKILKEGSASLDLNGLSSWSIAHGATVTTPYKYLLYIKYGIDGKTILIGGTAATKTYNLDTTFFGSTMDSTYIKPLFPGPQSGSTPMSAKYYILGSGANNSIPADNVVVAVSKTGKNALTETNPDNFNFHNAFSTLKYYDSGVYNMGSITNTTTVTIAHNLGYVPVFIAFVNDLAGITGGYALLPYYFGRSSGALPTRDVAAFAYADATNIYLKAYYQANAVGTSFTFNFYYKIFKNNLGL